jgi:hypothetical protein
VAKLEGVAPAVAKKEWSWSYSKLKNFETCPKRMYEIDICKSYVEEKVAGGPLDWGDRVHKVLADACRDGLPLATEYEAFQGWVDRTRERAVGGTLLVEQKYAITRDFRPTTYFAKDVWFRCIADIVILKGQIAMTTDWKTGKILEDSVQLMLVAQCLFSHFPQLQRVGTEFVWLKDDATSPEVFDRAEVANTWLSLLPRVSGMEMAASTMTYPPKPSGVCKKWCVVQSCPFHGKGPNGK